MATYDEKLIPLSKDLRNNPTSAERILWQRLRRSQLEGSKFRRQQPIGPFIVDFYCAPLKLVIELDGDSHGDKEGYDHERQAYLEAQGLTVIRFWDSDVRDNLQGVLQTIYDFCRSRK